ncbi:cell division protein FtsQ [Vibrio fluvialis]|uniref:Cell division protein FtsQ n=1 Tax=Vibrio fluvialis TaxID=676 RepID=A0AAX2LTT6_VIBFL|nr:cell division protein FtsQ [Vibrio fluvialis]
MLLPLLRNEIGKQFASRQQDHRTLINSVLAEGRKISGSPLVKQHAVGGSFFLVVVLLIGFLLYSTISWMWDEQRLPLSKIVLQGNLQYVSTLDVQRAFARLDHIGTFMSQDIDVLQTSVQSIPWVSHASIRKQWPDTIKVFLTEHQVQAIWNGNALLDDDGIVFDGDIGLVKEEHVKLYGPDGSAPEVLKVWRQYNSQFQAIGRNISSLLLNERRAWQIILDNGIRLELGKESLDERIARFFLLYKQLGNEVDKVSYIDLRYDTGAAVGWISEQELAQENTDD